MAFATRKICAKVAKNDDANTVGLKLGFSILSIKSLFEEVDLVTRRSRIPSRVPVSGTGRQHFHWSPNRWTPLPVNSTGDSHDGAAYRGHDCSAVENKTNQAIAALVVTDASAKARWPPFQHPKAHTAFRFSFSMLPADLFGFPFFLPLVATRTSTEEASRDSCPNEELLDLNSSKLLQKLP